jgi:hypothetical protein
MQHNALFGVGNSLGAVQPIALQWLSLTRLSNPSDAFWVQVRDSVWPEMVL